MGALPCGQTSVSHWSALLPSQMGAVPGYSAGASSRRRASEACRRRGRARVGWWVYLPLH